MITAEKPPATRAQFVAAFETERAKQYPMIDELEARIGYRIGREMLESAAERLACPVKRNPPNWQHGRVLYAHARRYFADLALAAGLLHERPRVRVLDIGTAKGFSALVLAWAMKDAGMDGELVSVDVIEPWGRVRRNTVAEVDGLRTLYETLEPWVADLYMAQFLKVTGVDWLQANPERVHFAFVDGKHSGHEVIREGRLLAARQQRGDVSIFDDVHIPDVNQAVQALEGDYRLTRLELLPARAYTVAVRR